MLVEGAREVTLEQLVVIDRLRHHTPHKLVIAEVIRVAVGGRVDGICDAIAGGRHEESVHRVEDLT